MARTGGRSGGGLTEDGSGGAARGPGAAPHRGRHIRPAHPSVEAVAVAPAAFRDVGHGEFEEVLDACAEACERIAAADPAFVGRHAEVDGIVASVVIGTVPGDAVLTAMRRLAQVDASARRYGERGRGSGRGRPGVSGGPDTPS
ncbi:hypothetical protein [Streptomyces sp. x-80]|uniref:hypothetical protein n=1 Tax=Streptomyces sp. x-80 TaxID=2789282 RepID=UPI00398022AA